MMPQSNPTSSSAVVGQRLTFRADRGRIAEVAKELTVPGLLAAAAAYLIVGIVTMEVPAGASFPGPEFFPALIAAALLLIAGLLVARFVRQRRAGVDAREDAPTTASISVLDASGTEVDEAEVALPQRAVRVDWRSMAWVVLSFAAFALLLQVLGWIVGAGLLFLGVAKGLGATGWVRPLVVGLTVSSISYIAFDMVLELSLPSGIVGWGF
ncbi:tripartite tricarboxylate transporter TctB family protein [Agrococcus sp. SGAir0287]|uniref:tripartite tricarboxylate transporter TctB family protein n=1 Tax=Agrococcus sp. SGAir0287 TaxID=2070347 RepID=UPI0010CCDFE6|nr:tripartite tricarboxylate transporter TctB family protein [Agrococcus sp. SGAir0287]QCR20534.1 tripartite tricarboxylate transporter TctB family protein [Agrococcus sp. SGAir0287]